MTWKSQRNMKMEMDRRSTILVDHVWTGRDLSVFSRELPTVRAQRAVPLRGYFGAMQMQHRANGGSPIGIYLLQIDDLLHIDCRDGFGSEIERAGIGKGDGEVVFPGLRDQRL